MDSDRKSRLHFEDEDARPPSMIRHRSVNLVALLVGLVSSVFVHAFVVAVVVAMSALTAATAGAKEELPEREAPPEMHFVAARLIKLGRHFDPRELPNRQRAARTTAPQQSDVPTKQSKRVRIPLDAGPAPTNAIQDLLRNIGTRADEAARIGRAAEQEGDPDGVAEGTATREEGDLYRTQLYGFFRRGLNRPTSISDSEIRGLRVVVSVQTAADGTITGYRIQSGSGNEDFDRAVRQRMEQTEGSRLPTPPDDERERYYGVSFTIGMVPPR